MEEKRIVKPWQAGLMLLAGTWMASGTVPVMIYYGMKVLTFCRSSASFAR